MSTGIISAAGVLTRSRVKAVAWANLMALATISLLPFALEIAKLAKVFSGLLVMYLSYW